MSQRNGGISISFTTQSSPQRLSEFVRDVTEKRWYFDFFHDTELAAEVERVCFVMSQRNVRYIAFYHDTEPKSIADMVLRAPRQIHPYCWHQTLPLRGSMVPSSRREGYCS